MDKNEIIERIKELKDLIEEKKTDIDDIENQIDSLETELDWENSSLESMEDELEQLEKYILTLQTPQEQIPYWLGHIHDSCRPNLDGQFERNGKWYVCNGYVLLESNIKFDCLEICEGLDSLPQHLDKEKEEISFDIDNLMVDLTETDVIIGKNCIVDSRYLLAIKNILQLTNDSKFYTTFGQTSTHEETKNLICENENGRALIIGKHIW